MGSRKFGLKKILGPKEFWVKTILRSKKVLVKQNIGKKKLDPKNLRLAKESVKKILTKFGQ